ncbi:MAG: hypothetical protein ACI4HZ_11045 [Ruminococcus sp.]
MMKSVMVRMKEINAEQRIADFKVKQKQPYWFKVKYARQRALEFQSECWERNLNYHVSVGGLDSIVLYLFLKKICISDAIGISVSSLEDKSIQKIHKALGITRLMPAKREDGHCWNKAKIIQEFGFPVLSKEIASKIELLQNPSEDNKTVRHAIITGETGEYGGFQKNSRMKLSQRWLELFGGYENENENVNYQKPDFLVSSKCCYYLKEKPCDDWAKENNSVPFLGLMASEGGRREKSLMINGCNYFGKSTIRSAPFAIFNRQDILHLTLEMDEWYRDVYRYKLSKQSGTPIEEYPASIIPEIYGEIETNTKGELYTTKAQRTGCSMCGFGIQLEKRPHRFDRLHETNLKEWEFWMYRCCTDKNGQPYGWGKVLDYIGVGWEFDENGHMIGIDGQMSLF